MDTNCPSSESQREVFEAQGYVVNDFEGSPLNFPLYKPEEWTLHLFMQLPLFSTMADEPHDHVFTADDYLNEEHIVAVTKSTVIHCEK